MTFRVGYGVSCSSEHDPNRNSPVLFGDLIESLLLTKWFVARHENHLNISPVLDIALRLLDGHYEHIHPIGIAQ